MNRTTRWRTMLAAATLTVFLTAPGAVGAPGPAEDPLRLRDAVDMALQRNSGLEVSRATEEQMRAATAVARSSLLPRVDYVESVTRGNNPIYVFGALLTQESFTEENFAVDSLNRPDPLSLYRSRLRLRQTVFDAGELLSLRRARLGEGLAAEERRKAEMDVIFDTVRAYHRVQLSEQGLATVSQALETAARDVGRARALLEAGMATEADVLALRVHRASIEEQEILARIDLAIARAELNRVLGTPLDRSFRLTTELEPRDGRDDPRASVEELEATALARNPDIHRSELDEERARVGSTLARSAFLPRVGFEAGWESDRVSFSGTGGTNWTVGLSVELNLLNGGADRARLRESEAALRRARASKRAQEDLVRLEVRRAMLELEASEKRVAVARESVAEARESHRITAARYEAGLADVTALLRSRDALLEAELRVTAALYADRLAGVGLAYVQGVLHSDAEVLKP